MTSKKIINKGGRPKKGFEKNRLKMTGQRMTIKPKTTLTWKERVMAATTGRNSRGAFLWYSHDKICCLIGEAEGLRVKDFYRSISAYLNDLVKSGHLERAVKPRHLSNKVRYDGKEEYLYRQTGKAYKRGNPGLISPKNQHSPVIERNALLSHELWRLHRTLPKWFRRMMFD